MLVRNDRPVSMRTRELLEKRRKITGIDSMQMQIPFLVDNVSSGVLVQNEYRALDGCASGRL